MFAFCAPLGVARSRQLAQGCATRVGSLCSASRFRLANSVPCTASIRASASNESVRASHLVDSQDIADDDDDDDDEKTITLNEVGTDLQLEVEISDEIQVDDKLYLLVTPVYDPITFALILPNGEAEPVEDFKPLIDAARAAVAQDHMNIIEAAYVGMVLDDDVAKDLEILNSQHDEDEEFEGDDADEDGVEVLAEFQVDRRDFAVTRSLAPLFLVAFQNTQTGEYEAVQQEELARISPKIEEEIMKRNE